MAADSGTRIRIADPDNVKETVALGPCIVSQQGPLTEIMFTMPRHDPEVVAGYRAGAPTLVVVGRIVMHPDGAAALVRAINESAARDKALAGRMIPDEQGGRA